MNIIVYPHDLNMGGSQLNAIEIAAGVRDLGHDVIIYGQPGSLCPRIADLGLEFVASPRARKRPTPSIVRHLKALADDRGVDVVHGYEWPPILEAYLAGGPVRTVGTIMSMSVPPFIPRHLPLIVGTAQIVDQARQAGFTHSYLLEPPVDVIANAPGQDAEAAAFRADWSIPRDATVVTCVSRLAVELKLEGLLTAIDVVPGLADDVVFVLVGDGVAAERVRRAAQSSNARLGRDAVIVTGELMDPRGAYAAADITLGMGGSALRAMAFAKPLIVQGEAGFWKTLTPESLEHFLWTGWYGVGSDAAEGGARLADELNPLLADPERRRQLGIFGRALVEDRFSLQSAARRQLDIYRASLTRPVDRAGRRTDELVAGAYFAGYLGRRWIAKLVRRAALDDFNSVAAARPSAQPPGPGGGDSTSRHGEPHRAPGQSTLVYIAGVHFDAVQGTDHRLVEQLSAEFDVLWVDPPTPMTKLFVRGGSEVPPGLRRLAPRVWRLTTWVTPGVTRPGLRRLAALCQVAALRLACRGLGWKMSHAVVADPTFPIGLLKGVRTVLLMTDDAVAGAALLGMDAAYAGRMRDVNTVAADAVVTVSAELADRVRSLGVDPIVMPNGCSPEIFSDARRRAGQGSTRVSRRSGAILVGQLNERLDASLLTDLVLSGVKLLIVGPRQDRDPRFRAALDALLSTPGVLWENAVPLAELPRFMGTARVGLTPYVVDDFNTASFPLKTLDYLAAGLPVVTTDLPASRWLNTDVVKVATTRAEFIRMVQDCVARDPSPEVTSECLQVAEAHSWQARARQLTRTIGLSDDTIQHSE